jgi:hypothetical protein
MAYALGWWNGSHVATKFARAAQMLMDKNAKGAKKE